MFPGSAWLRSLPPVVVVLGLTSLLNDVSSEMIYPLLPLFLVKELGAGPAFLGLVEGVADATASLINLASGLWADRVRDRSKLVAGGYGVSSAARCVLTAAPGPLSVLLIRFGDRVGKGIRTAPRDALMADAMPPAERGKAFGFHRAMDNAGSVLGPLLAAALLSWRGTRPRRIFALAALPALAAVLLVLLRVSDKTAHAPAARREPLGPPPRALRPYLAVLFVFGLSQSADAFLLLRASSLGVRGAAIPLLWAMFNALKVVSGLYFSSLSDRLGRRPVIAAGWLVYAAAYAGFSAASAAGHIWLLFLFYGFFYGLTEGPQRALLVDLSGPGGRGAAFGWYHAVSGASLLLASVLFGAVWQASGPPAAFLLGAAIAAAAAVMLSAIALPRANV